MSISYLDFEATRLLQANKDHETAQFKAVAVRGEAPLGGYYYEYFNPLTNRLTQLRTYSDSGETVDLWGDVTFLTEVQARVRITNLANARWWSQDVDLSEERCWTSLDYLPEPL